MLTDAADPLHIADIERILGAAIARTFALELAMRLLFAFGLLQRGELAFAQHQAFLGDLGFEGLEPFLHRLQVMALPYAAHAGRRDNKPALRQFVGNPDLAKSGLLDGERNHSILDLLRHSILQDWLLAADSCSASSPPWS